MTAFAAMLRAIHADRNMAVDALHLAADSSARVPCRVIRRAPDETTQFGGGQFVGGTTILDVLAVEVATPRRGDIFLVDGQLLRVTADPRRDTDRLSWTVEVRPE